jgi:hypothetical protein
MTLQAFRDGMSAFAPTYHYEAHTQENEYIVWTEYNREGYYGSNRRLAQKYLIQVDVYTRIEFTPLIEALESAWKEWGVAYSGSQTLYETGTKYIHHWWELEVLADG